MNEQSKIKSGRLLLFVYDKVHFVEQIELARGLKREGSFEPFIAIYVKYPERSRDFRQCIAEGFGCCDESGHLISQYILDNSTDELIALPRSRFSSILLISQQRCALYHMCILRHQTKETSNLLRNIDPCAVIICEDHVEGVSAPLIHSARLLKIPIFVMPYTLCTAEEAAQYYFENRRHRVGVILKFLMPSSLRKWLYNYKGRDLLRIPLAPLMARELLRLSPGQPWIPNSGCSNAMLIESIALKKYWERAGLDPQKLSVTGSPIHDRMAMVLDAHRERKEQLLAKYNLPHGRRLVLCALPFSAFPNRVNHCEFATYEGLIEFIFDTFGAMKHWNIIIRLHPRLDKHAFDVSRYSNIRIADEPTYELLPLCDLFVASGSATIRWALTCNKPVINYDIYQYGYSDFSSEPSVTLVQSKGAFQDALNMRELNSESLHHAPETNWGVLDGKACARIAGVIRTVCRISEGN